MAFEQAGVVDELLRRRSAPTAMVGGFLGPGGLVPVDQSGLSSCCWRRSSRRCGQRSAGAGASRARRSKMAAGLVLMALGFVFMVRRARSECRRRAGQPAAGWSPPTRSTPSASCACRRSACRSSPSWRRCRMVALLMGIWFFATGDRRVPRGPARGADRQDRARRALPRCWAARPTSTWCCGGAAGGGVRPAAALTPWLRRRMHGRGRYERSAADAARSPCYCRRPWPPPSRPRPPSRARTTSSTACTASTSPIPTAGSRTPTRTR